MTYVPLKAVSAGIKAQFCEFLGSAAMQQRLIGLGLVPGAQFTVLQNRKGHGLMISLGHHKIAVGHSLSQQIIVTPA